MFFCFSYTRADLQAAVVEKFTVFRPVSDRLMEIDDPVVICLIHKWRGDQEICGCPVVSDRDVIDLSNTKECLYIWIMRLGSQRI